MRIGIGYDIHKLSEGRLLILGGIKVPYKQGLLGHSDADVLLHAITDALLGAAALGDIGQHFPDTDTAFKDADSRELLRKAVHLVLEKGYNIKNVDATIIAERPKLAPYLASMRQNISQDIGIAMDAVNIKAKTNEGMGETGRGDAIAALAIASIV